MDVHLLFAPCPGFLPESGLSRRDCSECRRNYAEHVCPDFRERFLRMLGQELDLELHQMGFVAHKVRVQ